MKKLLTLTFITFCAALSQLSAVEAPPRGEMLQMVDNEQFTRLEKLMGELRSQKIEFYKGSIPLRVAYDELDSLSRTRDDDQAWEDYIAHLQKWAAAYPESPTPQVALGNVYASWAWKARGGGYANTVTDEGWRLMQERLDKARICLETAATLPVKDPEVYRSLLRVALGQGWAKDEMDGAFQKGIAIEPNYLRLYEAKAYFLLPRWYGRPGEWEAFAKQAAEARGGDEGDILYMHIARSQAWSEGEDFFQNTSISFERMQRGFEASLKRDPDDLSDLNSYCYFACIADNGDTAKKLFERINGQWSGDVWRNEKYFKQWEQWGLHDDDRPAAARSTAPVVSAGKPKSVIVIFVGVWLGLLAIIGVIIWLVIRKPKNA